MTRLDEHMGHASPDQAKRFIPPSFRCVLRRAGEEVEKRKDGRLGGSRWYYLGVEENLTHPAAVGVITQPSFIKFENPPGSFPFKL